MSGRLAACDFPDLATLQHGDERKTRRSLDTLPIGNAHAAAPDGRPVRARRVELASTLAMSLLIIYATRNDLLTLLAEVESARAISYTQAGLSGTKQLRSFLRADQIPRLGEVAALSPHHCDRWLIASADAQLTIREVPQRRGGVKFSIDQQLNPDTIAFLPGGQLDAKTVVAGNISTCTASPISADLFKTFRKIAGKRWASIQSWAVGPQAEAILDAGGRLSQGLHPNYDLRR